MTHLFGTVTEIVVARWLRGEYDAALYDHSDDGTDVVCHAGRVSVKATAYRRRPWLRVEVAELHKRNAADVFLCVYYDPAVDERLIEVHGWVTRCDLLSLPTERIRPDLPANKIVRAGLKPAEWLELTTSEVA